MTSKQPPLTLRFVGQAHADGDPTTYQITGDRHEQETAARGGLDPFSSMTVVERAVCIALLKHWTRLLEETP